MGDVIQDQHGHDRHDDHNGGHGHNHRVHGHDHDEGVHGHDHHDDHGHDGGWWHRLSHLVTPHSHDSTDKVDQVMEAYRDGLRALWISLAVLGATALLQAIVVVSRARS